MFDQEELDSVVHDFLVESYENLERLDREFVELERDPSNREVISSIFRTIHTIKGTCGFLGFSKLESVAHKGENLLSKLRDGLLQTTHEITTALLSMVDAIREILARIESTGAEGDDEYAALVAELIRLASGDAAPAEAAPAEPAAPATPAAATATPALEAAAPAPAPVKNVGDILIEEGKASPAAVAAAAAQQKAGDPRHLGEILVDSGVIRSPDVVDALQKQQSQAAASAAPGIADSSIRVDVSVLDKLMNLVGELVLARNQMQQFMMASEDSAFTATCQRLNLVTSELQEGVMKTRMQPIGGVWSKFPRVVRDLSQSLGKQIRLEMEGKDTELDRTLIEAIKDPLTHLVRNAVDHGVEAPDVRQKNGKPAEGRLFLGAFHEGGLVNIQITDDGGGIDPEKIKNIAMQKGLITAEQATRMGEREALNLIFLPGFSTAAKVTNVSGRGVGMDVVKTNIERIGGTVDVSSQLGRGSTFKIKIPLTLAIIPALIVSDERERYAIPQVSLVELVRLEAEQARTAIEQIHGVQVYRLRGDLLPLVHLREALESGPVGSPTGETAAVNIVVLQADDRQFGLVVENVLDTEEIVVKPLARQLKKINCLAGATILGDGKIALILDAMGIAQRMHVVSELRERAIAEAREQTESERMADRQTLLLFRTPDDGRMAIPLEMVSRLEEFAEAKVEAVGSQRMIQYRGEIMPLIDIGEVLPERRSLGRMSEDDGSSEAMLQVVVHTHGGRSVGIVVDQILDIIEDHVELHRPGGRSGVIGTAVIRDRVTEFIDIQAVIESVAPDFFEAAEAINADRGACA